MTSKSRRSHGVHENSRKYHIRGTTPDQKARTKQKRSTPIHSAAMSVGKSDLTVRCIVCMNPRDKSGYPICDDCQTKNRANRRK